MDWLNEIAKAVNRDRIVPMRIEAFRPVIHKLIAAIRLAEAKLVQISLLSNEEKTRVRASKTASRIRSGDVESKP